MAAAFVILIIKLPAGLTISDTLSIAGGMQKLQAVDFSVDAGKRYTLWSGIIAATFHMLAYFGTDQSQVQRYIGGASLRESRLGLMFNAVLKIPMQFFILMLGVLLFVFYQFERPPVYFDKIAWQEQAARSDEKSARDIETRFAATHKEEQKQLLTWVYARHTGDATAAASARTAAVNAHERLEDVRKEARLAVDPHDKRNDTDYIFITFIMDHFPHGFIGLLVASFFAAALSAKAAELNALGSSTTIDFYRHVIRPDADDARCLKASRLFTIMWGAVSIAFALGLSLAENLIQAVNIVGAIFYPVMLSLFVVGFFLPQIGGRAVFWGALIAQALVLTLFFTVPDKQLSYLWYNVIGCIVCIAAGGLIQIASPPTKSPLPA
jgi:Na+/proline symporter